MALDNSRSSNVPDGLRYNVVVQALIKLGDVARDVTPALVEHSRGASWDDRAVLAAALAAVGDARAVPYLTDALAFPDWRVNLSAATALARIGAAAAPGLPALARMEREHWLPRARLRAAYARAAIGGGNPRPLPVAASAVPTEGDCQWNFHGEDQGWKLASDVGTPSWPTGVSLDSLRPGRFVTYRAAGGQLIGTEGDEGDGELLWVPQNAGTVLVRKGAVFAIIRVGSSLLVVQSFAEYSHTVSDLERTGPQTWQTHEVLQLPGAPRAFRALPGGWTAIETQKGTLEMDHAGTVRHFECIAISQHH